MSNHHEGHHHTSNIKVLMAAFILTTIFAVLEVIYGLISHSLSLLSEGIHMSSDGLSLLIAATAVWLATKKPTKTKNFGYRRAEPIAAFLNGLGLIAIPIVVMFEAIKRLWVGGQEILSKEMFVVAVIGLIVNLAVAFLLSKGEKDNINVRAAALHIIADLLSSLSTIIVSLLIMYFDFVFIDAIASFVISIIILLGGWKITKESINILMEGTPEYVNLDDIETNIKSISGIMEIKDIKVWSIAHDDDYMNIKIATDGVTDIRHIVQEIKKIGDNNNLKTAIEIN